MLLLVLLEKKPYNFLRWHTNLLQLQINFVIIEIYLLTFNEFSKKFTNYEKGSEIFSLIV